MSLGALGVEPSKYGHLIGRATCAHEACVSSAAVGTQDDSVMREASPPLVTTQQNRTLYLETAMGQVQHSTNNLLWRWVELTRPAEIRDWRCKVSSFETCSSPQNAALYTWASLWSPTWDARPTGEDVLNWRSRAYWYAQNAPQRPANQ